MMKRIFILAVIALLMQPVGCTKPDPLPDDQEQTDPEQNQPEEPQPEDPQPEDPKEPEQPEEEDPRAPILKINALTSTKACIRIDYSFEKVTEFNQSVNVCFSTEPNPTVDDQTFNLPPRSANKADTIRVVCIPQRCGWKQSA